MNEEHFVQPDRPFVETLQATELPAILKDVGEIGLDLVIEDKLLKDIPILDWVWKFLHGLEIDC